MTIESSKTPQNAQTPSPAMSEAFVLMTAASEMAALGMRMQELADQLSERAGDLVTGNGEDFETLFDQLVTASD